MDQFENAVTAYKTAIELKGDHFGAWNNIGLLYDNLSK